MKKGVVSKNLAISKKSTQVFYSYKHRKHHNSTFYLQNVGSIDPVAIVFQEFSVAKLVPNRTKCTHFLPLCWSSAEAIMIWPTRSHIDYATIQPFIFKTWGRSTLWEFYFGSLAHYKIGPKSYHARTWKQFFPLLWSTVEAKIGRPTRSHIDYAIILLITYKTRSLLWEFYFGR